MYKKYILRYAGLVAADRQVQSGEARRDFSSLLDEVEHHGVRIEIRRYNDPAAYLVPPDWYDRAERAERELDELRAELARIRQETPPPG